MRWLPLIFLYVTAAVAVTRSPDIPFKSQMIDNGASETAAVVDVDRDGKLDIVSGENWYAAPAWTKHKFRDLNYTSNYFDNFSDLPVDVDGDGYPDLVGVTWFAKKVAWWKNPGRAARLRPEGGAKPPSESEREPSAALGVGPRRNEQTSGPPSSDKSALWPEAAIHTGFNIEFAVLADMNNDGKAQEVVAQENGTPQAWYEVRQGAWVAHVVSDKSYGHGIGAGDVNKDGRTDILTPRGWLEAPADPTAGNWTFHADWEALNVPPAAPGAPPAAAPAPMSLGFMHVDDVNGDGRNDVIAGAGHDYGVFWFEQGDKGKWTRRVIDNAWSQAHASTLVDLNGDGRKDVVTGKRFMAHNGGDPGEKEPLGIYWYEYKPAAAGAAGEWMRHVIEYGGRIGAGMQLPVIDIDGDGDLDIVCPGKSGLFLVENLTKRLAAPKPSAKAGAAGPKS